MKSQTAIDVRLPSRTARRYRIHIAAGLMERLPRILAGEYRGRKVWIVTDSNVLRLYGRHLQRSLALNDVDVAVVEIPPGEGSKNERIVHAVQTRLLEHGIDRNSVVIALGGGVVGDVAGFVAATVLRGIRYVQVPTTLLAQVDSSVGGKVGINHRLGKNLIGAFHQPSAVYIDPAVLSTLPGREFRNGYAEIIKIAAALDRKFFRDLERTSGKISRKRRHTLAGTIARAVRLKSGIVARDEREESLRKVLNLGHTIGHAVEAATRFTIHHGEGVAIGLAAEAEIAVAMGLLPPAECERMIRLLRRAGLPVRLPRRWDRARFLRALSADKKSEQGSPRFVLLRGLGRCVVGVDVPSPFLLELSGRPS